MKIIDHINFNKDCIRMYAEENIDKIYNSKIFMLLKENIEYYRELNKKVKVINKVTYEPRQFKNIYKIKDSEYIKETVEDYYGSYDNYLQFNK